MKILREVRKLLRYIWWDKEWERSNRAAAMDIYTEHVAHVNDVTGEGYSYHIRRTERRGSDGVN